MKKNIIPIIILAIIAIFIIWFFVLFFTRPLTDPNLDQILFEEHWTWGIGAGTGSIKLYYSGKLIVESPTFTDEGQLIAIKHIEKQLDK